MDRDDLVLAYVQGRLPEAERGAFDARLSAEPDLAAEVAALQAMRDAFAQADAEIAPDQGWARLEAAIDAAPPAAANVNAPLRLPLWQVGGLIAASLALWQVAVVPTLGPGLEPGFETVGAPTQADVLQVLFAPGADVSAVTALLRDVGGTVVDGPSAIGLYRVSFSSAEALGTAREALTARTDLIEMVTVE